MASRILRYLAGTQLVGIGFEIDNKKNLHGYADSDWAADKTTRKSQSARVATAKLISGRVVQIYP